MRVQVLFIVGCFLADTLIGLFLPHSFLPGDIVFVPCLGMSALVLSQKRMNRVDSFLIAVIGGFLYGFLEANQPLVYAIVFGSINLIVDQWKKHIMDSLTENCVLVIVTIFVKEFLVYLMMTILGVTQMPLQMWLVSRAILTIVVNGLFVVLIVFVSRMIEDIMLLREKRIRKEEVISWWNVLSKR